MGKLIELIIRAMPYPNQIQDIEIATDYVEFTWRGVRYRATESLSIDEVGNGVLVGTDRAILIRKLLEQARLHATSSSNRSNS
jgi:hypothetical protein